MTTFVQSVKERANCRQEVLTISLTDLDVLAQEHGLSRRAAEIAALEQGVLPLRYLRNVGTIGLEGQRALLQSAAVVIGLGGLGGYVVEGLARMGVGRLVLVDGDRFFDHNLNRQLLSSEQNLDVPKSQVAQERVSQINSAIEIRVYQEFATSENLGEILSGADVVVDALDRLPTRMVLQQAAAEAGVPMVHGAIAGGLGQVMTILPGDAGLKALYGEGPVPEHGAEVELGTPAPSPMMVAAWQVHEAIKVLTGRGELLRNRMLFMDATSAQVHVLGLQGSAI